MKSVFEGLYDACFYSSSRLSDGATEEIDVSSDSDLSADDYIVTDNRSNGKGKVTILKRSIVREIEGNKTWSALFNELRNREKILHFADGYPYYVAMRQGISNGEMSTKERAGWGIYHEMISPEGSYAYVVDLTNGVKEAKYDEFYGAALSTMEDFGDYLNTQVNKIFTQIITGEKPLSYFEEFAADYNKTGGDKILSQINAWYDAQPKKEG